MSLNLLNSNGIPQDAARADAARASRLAGHAEANAQHPTEGSLPPRGTLSPERLREIAARLESNYYDRPEVVDRIAGRLLPDLHSQE
jgi:hypothetical protein